MRTKTAYVIRSGEMIDGRDVSKKLRTKRRLRSAIRAAKRMGFPHAYACQITVSADCRLV